MTKVSTIAATSGVTVQTVYRHVKRLEKRLAGHVSNADGVSLFDDTAVDMLRASIGAAKTLVSPMVAPVTIAPDTARLEALEKSMMLLADEVASQRKTIALQEGKLSSQEKEIAFLRSRGEIPVLLLSTPPKPVKPWEPVRVRAVPMPWYERLWLQVFSPESLRSATE